MQRYSIDSNLLDTSVNPKITPQLIHDFIAKYHANSPMANDGTAFLNSSNRYGMNVIFVVAHAIHETGWGLSGFAINRHNLFGIAAFDSNPGNARTFASDTECIEYYCSWVSGAYLKPSGRWWGGSATLRGMHVHYATGSSWADNIAAIMNMFATYLESRGIDNGDTTPPTNPPADNAHFVTVQSGWGLIRIAQAAGFADANNEARWAAIAALNGSNDWHVFNSRLRAGQVVRVRPDDLPPTNPQPPIDPTTDLRNQLNQALSERDQLRVDIANLLSDRQNLANQIDELNNIVNQQRDMIDTLNSQIAGGNPDSAAALAECQSDKMDLENEISSLNDTIHDLESRLANSNNSATPTPDSNPIEGEIKNWEVKFIKWWEKLPYLVRYGVPNVLGFFIPVLITVITNASFEDVTILGITISGATITSFIIGWLKNVKNKVESYGLI
jgi:hypothetical protein